MVWGVRTNMVTVGSKTVVATNLQTLRSQNLKKRKHLTSPRSKTSRTQQYLELIGPHGVKTNLPPGFMSTDPSASPTSADG